MARLLFFGRLADRAGGRRRERSLGDDVLSVADLIAALAAEDAALGDALRDISVKYVVNETVVGVDYPIGDDDEIAFLPPASGG
ncbi:MAG: MoaD/ThiS family protein [Pseudomonadota bacterium]